MPSPTQSETDLDWVPSYLESRGFGIANVVSARELPGGVSGMVIAVDGPPKGLVIKRSRSRLQVPEPWYADRERTTTEGRAMRVAREITPARVPRILDMDETTMTVIIERIPDDAVNWREALLAAPADPAIGRELGATLAQWHERTWRPWTGSGPFRRKEVFRQLRIHPFYEVVADKFPNLRSTIEQNARDLMASEDCLVHGDFSPKNVLVRGSRLWIVDFEVAHIGDPVFDLAYLGAHICLTAIMRPSFLDSLDMAWRAFHQAYAAGVHQVPEPARVLSHIGCILLARTDGLSLEPGLNDETRATTRRVAEELLENPASALDGLWRPLVGRHG
jgi:aminoglycoside phosphotransferase (APT) family kinase protein